MNLYPPNLVPFYQGSTIYINLGTIIQYFYSPLYFSMLERANTSNKSFCPGLLLSRYHHWSIVMWPFLQNEPQKSISQPSIFYGWNHTINCMRTLPLVDPKMTMWRRRFHICSSNQEGQNWRDLYKNGRGTLRGSQGSSRGDTWGGTFDDLCDSIFSLSIILQLMMISIFFLLLFQHLNPRIFCEGFLWE